MSRLLVMYPGRLEPILQKGELNPRYFNPGEVFDHVDILLTNDDQPDAACLQKTVGRATLAVHNYPVTPALLVKTLGFRKPLVQIWARGAVGLARQLDPDLIRCYGADINCFLASRIKREAGIPYVVSLHTNPDEGARWNPGGFKHQLVTRLIEPLIREGMREAELVLPVYQPAVPYLKKRGITRYRVAYNFLDSEGITAKEDYTLGSPARILSVGRQVPGKNPENILRAVAGIQDSHLTLVGDGSLHEGLKSLAEQLGVGDRVEFLKSVENRDLVRMMPGFDIFAAHSQYAEIPKTVIEALLTGLPVVTNRREGFQVEEYAGGIVRLVDDSVQGYHKAIVSLLEDEAEREALGRKGREEAVRLFDPRRAEAVYADIFLKLLNTSPLVEN